MSKRRKERLDASFSVFNSHINDASDRADAEFIAQFGQQKFDAWIKPHHEAGIMGIFQAKPTRWRFAWVALVTAFVNEDRS